MDNTGDKPKINKTDATKTIFENSTTEPLERVLFFICCLLRNISGLKEPVRKTNVKRNFTPA
jgi:hypothetical protein